MAALGFGGDSHEEGSGAAREVSHVQRPGKLVVAPVHVRRPILEDQATQQGGGGDGGVVRAGELGISEQGVE